MKNYTREVVVKGHVDQIQLSELLLSLQHLEHMKFVISHSTHGALSDLSISV